MDDILSADEVQAIATANGLTNRDLCRAAGVAETTLYNWLAGGDVRTGVYKRLLAAARAGKTEETAA